MTEIAKQLHWIRNVYEELGFKLGPLPLCVDNQGAMFLASNPAQEGRTKHIRIPEHYIREAVELEEIMKQPNKPVYRALGNPTRGKVTSQSDCR